MSDNAAIERIRDQLAALHDQRLCAELHVMQCKEELEECKGDLRKVIKEIKAFTITLQTLERARKARYNTKRYNELREAESVETAKLKIVGEE